MSPMFERAPLLPGIPDDVLILAVVAILSAIGLLWMRWLRRNPEEGSDRFWRFRDH